MGFGQVSRRALAVLLFLLFCANYQPEPPWIGPIPQSGRGAKPKNSKLVSVPVSAFIDLIGVP